METLDTLFGNFALWTSLTANLIVAVIMLLTVISGDKLLRNDPLYRVFILFMVVGLIGQGIRSYYALVLDMPPTDGEKAFWIFKDFALVVWATRYHLIKLGRIKERDIEFLKCNNEEHLSLMIIRTKVRKARESGNNEEVDRLEEEFDNMLLTHSDKTSLK